MGFIEICMLILSLKLTLVFFFTLFALYFFKPIAIRIGLVDSPCSRKQHDGFIPLVGGIGVFAGIIFASTIFGFITLSITSLTTYFFCITILVVLGVIDDAVELSVKVRLIVQIFITFIMMVGTELYIHDLGLNNISLGVNLGWFGYVLTVLAVLGGINAFNMIDGIDGLCASLAITALTPMALAFSWGGQVTFMSICLIISAALLPFLMMNLKLFFTKHKIMMGDAGSMMLGFSVVFLLIAGSQVQAGLHSFGAAAALWFIAIPLMDMAAIMIRRIRKGQSPFKADRNHLHHIFLHAGFTSKQSLIIIVLVQTICSAIGLVGVFFSISGYVLMAAFVIIFIGYSTAIQHIWRVSKYLRARRIHRVRLVKADMAG